MKNIINTKFRIKDIAQKAGVSVGTVDRVLHGRGRVAEQSLHKVEAAIKELDYSPNHLARALAHKKTVHFAALLPKHNPGEYWASVELGLSKACIDFSDYNLDLTIFYFNQFDAQSYEGMFDKVADPYFEGVIMPPMFVEPTYRLIRRLEEQNTPYIYIDSFLKQTQPLAYFGQHSYQSGWMAAKILQTHLQEEGEVLICRLKRKSDAAFNQTAEREQGFREYFKDTQTTIQTLTLDTDNHAGNESMIREVYATHPHIGAIVTFNSRGYWIADTVEKALNKRIYIIGYDLLNDNIQALKKGRIGTLIAQRPITQGYGAVKVLCQHIVFKAPVRQINYMPIDILEKENIDYYVDYETNN